MTDTTTDTTRPPELREWLTYHDHRDRRTGHFVEFAGDLYEVYGSHLEVTATPGVNIARPTVGYRWKWTATTGKLNLVKEARRSLTTPTFVSTDLPPAFNRIEPQTPAPARPAVMLADLMAQITALRAEHAESAALLNRIAAAFGVE